MARALLIDRHERYTVLAFSDSKPYAAEVEEFAAGDSVRFDWALRGFGFPMTTGPASVEVRVDGIPLDDVAVDLSPVAAPDRDGSTGVLTGAVTFRAPSTPGRHIVSIHVDPISANGTALPTPGFLTAFIEIAP